MKAGGEAAWLAAKSQAWLFGVSSGGAKSKMASENGINQRLAKSVSNGVAWRESGGLLPS
jgi:hypothetical protein